MKTVQNVKDTVISGFKKNTKLKLVVKTDKKQSLESKDLQAKKWLQEKASSKK